MKEANRAPCSISSTVCQGEVDVTAPGTHQHISGGWLTNRTGGGAHGVRVPQRDAQWACGPCVDQLADGLEGQGSLL